MPKMKMQECYACGQTVPTNGHGLFKEHGCSGTGARFTSKDGKCVIVGTGTEVDFATMKANGWSVCPAHSRLVWVLANYSAQPACDVNGCNENPKRGGKDGHWRYQGKPKAGGITIPDDEDDEVQPAAKSTPIAVSESSLNLTMLGTLGETIQAYVDARAAEIATEMILKLDLPSAEPMSISWTVNDKPFAVVDGTHHKALPRLLKLYAAGFRNFLIVGPAGSGKTTLAYNLAEALSLRFAQVSCTSGMSESALTGRAIPNLSNGETSFQSTGFVECYEAGGVFLLDEVDAADPNVMLVINTALANGAMPLPNRVNEATATRHADSVIICAANTYGTGADRQYVGRNQLDAAFLDRFVGATIEVDYDRDLESKLVGDAHICARVWHVRDKVQELRLRRVVGTRFLLSVTRLVKGAGETLDAALTACTVGWTADERSKAGVKEAN